MSPRINSYGQPVGDDLPQWEARPRPERIALTGDYCTLTPFSAKEHGKALFHAYSQAQDGRDWTWLPVGPFLAEQDYLEYAATMEQSQDPLHYAIVDNASGLPVGSVALMRIDVRNGVVEVGHVTYSPLLKGTRVATEAQYLLMKYVFDTLGYRRYEWKCDNLNEPSRRAAQRLGFQPEGVFRQAVVYKGRTRDTAWFSLLDKEWPSNKKALASWLSGDNFDANGSQLHPLSFFRS